MNGHTERVDVVGIASVAHEANRAYCLMLGEDSQVPWEHAPRWQRESKIAGVFAVMDGTAKTPKEQHDAWAAHKIAEGWMYGVVKDADAKTHPCLVPYDELPPEQQRKDALFRAVVLALLPPETAR